MSKNEKITLGIATLSLVVAIGVAMYVSYQSGFNTGANVLSLGGVTNYDSLTLSDDLVVDKTSTLTGTTTVTQSVDGMVIGGNVSTAATGTAITVYTNTTGPKVCDAGTGYFLEKNTGLFVPGHEWSLGTSTASAVATTNLIASSTAFATTTPGTAVTYLQLPVGSKFLLQQAETLVAMFDTKISNLVASSTHISASRFSAEVGIWCQDISL